MKYQWRVKITFYNHPSQIMKPDQEWVCAYPPVVQDYERCPLLKLEFHNESVRKIPLMDIQHYTYCPEEYKK